MKAYSLTFSDGALDLHLSGNRVTHPVKFERGGDSTTQRPLKMVMVDLFIKNILEALQDGDEARFSHRRCRYVIRCTDGRLFWSTAKRLNRTRASRQRTMYEVIVADVEISKQYFAEILRTINDVTAFIRIIKRLHQNRMSRFSMLPPKPFPPVGKAYNELPRSPFQEFSPESRPKRIRLNSRYVDPPTGIDYPAGTILHRSSGGQYIPLGLGLGEGGAIASLNLLQGIYEPTW